VGRAGGPPSGIATVRPARPEDGVGLSALLGVLGYPCPAEEAAQRVLDLRDDRNQTLLVAELEGQLAGLVCCDLSYYLPLGAFTCRITALSVAEAAQRQGIGRLLLREAESLARAAGAVRIELTSAAHREEAHAFYRACGYGEGAVRFVKRLGDA
jgi:GNAT superfamily N-acetyltransferase